MSTPPPLSFLLVEDERFHVELIRRSLVTAPRPIRLRVASSLAEAKGLLAEELPDLMVVDYLLPDGRGTQLLPGHPDRALFPIILMTSYGDEKVAVEALKAGALDYLVKSEVAFNDMPRLIDRALREWGHIDQSRRTAAELRKSEERYRLLVENAGEGIGVVQGSRFQWVNPRLCGLWGRSMEELTRGNSVDYIHPEDRSQAVDRLLKQLGEDDRPQVFSARVLAADGSTRWVLASVVRIVWEDRPAALCFFTDISEIKRMEREREGLEARLIQAHKMEALGTLASGIAHDFNNILGAILGFSEMSLLSAPEGSMLRRNLGRVIDAAQRATDLVRQILTFSRQSEQEKKPVLLGTIAKETLRMLRATLPATIEVKPRLETEAPVLADPTQMHQVILNLCTNAGQAMRAHGGRLDLKLTEVTLGADSQAIPPDLTPGPYVLLSVSDTGNGIAPEILPRIFDPFFTTKDKGEGTGMGLAVVHGIVRGHQGTVLVDSLPGQGSTFNVYLPRLEPLAAGKDETGPGKTLVGRRERILFVDDEEPLVELATQVLTRLGYEVVGRTSSPAALDLFRENPDRFDLVITDYTMPRMTGADLAREILALRPSLPVILCTGYSEDMTPDLAADIGVRTYLNKPVPLAELSQAIRRILEDRP